MAVVSKPGVARIGAAIVAGLLMLPAFQPVGWWPLALVAVAVLTAALLPWRMWSAPTLRQAFGLGYLFGVVFLFGHLNWVGVYVGAFAPAALAAFLALYYGLFALGAAAIMRTPWPAWLQWPAVALWFVASEAAYSRFPFGGFPWPRLGWSQVGGPLQQWAVVGGPVLVSAMAALAGVGLLGLLRRRFVTSAAMLLVPLVLPAVLLVWPGVGGADAEELGAGGVEGAGDAGASEQLEVLAVQGNVPRLGLDFNAQRRAVLTNHVDQTLDYVDRQVKTGARPEPQLVLWPENASDVSPFRDQAAADLIDRAAVGAQAPIVAGTFTYGPEQQVYNSMVVWDPQQGPTGEVHEKIHVQPFGEYMPYRSFFRKFTSLVDQAGFIEPGAGDGVLNVEVAGRDAPVQLGIATCYEVAFDPAYRRAVGNGAQLLVTPTNNATFGFTDMTYQQLAMSRMRAIEMDRAVVVVATSGVSALVLPDGSVIEQSEIFEPAQLAAALPLKDSRTIASRFGAEISRAVITVGAIGGLLALGLSLRRRRGTTVEVKHQQQGEIVDRTK
ncbi:apolipoprotein N-acyltransferase [Corynebacterium ulceribovis]|uniref:apolipoprotein N-acyltransferase n=1 Tax=Corynebacterium ulceribovis TaxID=487732 RepID=UPI000364FEBE|nr:apolipoprotein N-acyltransferase [Corynebacterium ulceribovis]